MVISGWVDSVRSHGKIIFIDLRDASGIMQVVLKPDKFPEAEKIRSEWVLQIKGKVKERPDSMINDKIVTGKVELEATNLTILSEAETVPFEVLGDGKDINEEIRMKYRYLDIRRERMRDNLKIRHKITHFFRSFLTEKDFIEVETPILSKSTPEGARDFLVPSRNQKGHFYALPQSPQQYKQLLMVGGLEKYFQFARCFRDEDIRADRQAEFTQLDMEVSFMDRDQILDLVEKMFVKMVKEIFPEKKIQQVPFPRITHSEAMKKWNIDRPDLRKNPDDPNELAFAFVVDFPMFEKFDGGWRAEHHPFTKPTTDDPEEIKNNPKEIKSLQYDLVLNGEEVGGGSIRTVKPEILKAIFEVLGHSESEVEEKFGHLLNAFKYGAPPHGGIAFGFERVLMMILGEENIREVMAFPKTGDGRDLMMEAPSADLSKEQLEELSIEIKEEDE